MGAKVWVNKNAHVLLGKRPGLRVASQSPVSLCNYLSYLWRKNHLEGPSVANPGEREKGKKVRPF